MISFVFLEYGETIARVDQIIERDHMISLRFIDRFILFCTICFAAPAPRLQRNDPLPNRIRFI